MTLYAGLAQRITHTQHRDSCQRPKKVRRRRRRRRRHELYRVGDGELPEREAKTAVGSEASFAVVAN